MAEKKCKIDFPSRKLNQSQSIIVIISCFASTAHIKLSYANDEIIESFVPPTPQVQSQKAFQLKLAECVYVNFAGKSIDPKISPENVRK